MGKFGLSRAVLAGAAVVALAGCGSSAGSSASSPASAAGSTSSAAPSTVTASPAATPSATSNSFVAAGSLPFPIAVGNTWVYQTVVNINNSHSIATNKVLSVVPVPGGNRVTMSQTTNVTGTATTTYPVFTFFSNGKIAYPLNQGSVAVVGSGVIWPDAADLASGKAFRSVLRIRTGTNQYQNANVVVRGGGQATVTVPAGTYRATLVIMTLTDKVGSYTSTVRVETWDAAGTGPVKSEVFIVAGGKTVLATTQELLSFTKGTVGS